MIASGFPNKGSPDPCERALYHFDKHTFFTVLMGFAIQSADGQLLKGDHLFIRNRFRAVASHNSHDTGQCQHRQLVMERKSCETKTGE
jgi:hypothetical protein